MSLNDLLDEREAADLAMLARAAGARSAAQSIPRTERRLVAVEAADLLAATFPPRDTLLAPWLQSQSLCMVHARRRLARTRCKDCCQ